jgi:hypothetical protein
MKIETKMKMVLKPVAGTEQQFALVFTKVLCPNSYENKWMRVLDLQATRRKYKDMLQGIPAVPGVIIISGRKKDNGVTTLKIIRSNTSLKDDVYAAQKGERIVSFIELIKENNFSSLEFQYAKSA